jgi:hypothetical protein
VAGSCESSSEPPHSIKRGAFLDLTRGPGSILRLTLLHEIS